MWDMNSSIQADVSSVLPKLDAVYGNTSTYAGDVVKDFYEAMVEIAKRYCRNIYRPITIHLGEKKGFDVTLVLSSDYLKIILHPVKINYQTFSIYIFPTRIIKVQTFKTTTWAFVVTKFVEYLVIVEALNQLYRDVLPKASGRSVR